MTNGLLSPTLAAQYSVPCEKVHSMLIDENGVGRLKASRSVTECGAAWLIELLDAAGARAFQASE
jgi:hypothetical protein